MSLPNDQSKGRIAFVVPSLGDGGSNRFMIKVAMGMASEGFQVDLIAIDPTGSYEDMDLKGVRRIDLSTINIKGMTVLNAILSISFYIRKQRPKKIMAATTAVNILLLFAKAISFSKTQIVVSERNAIKASAIDASRTSRLYRKLIHFMYPRASDVVAVSQGVADELTKDFGLPVEKVRVIYNPVISDDLVKQSKEKLVDDWFGQKHKPIIVSVGRLHPQKDYPTLIRAFALLNEHVQARLIILGEGRCREEIEQLCNELGLEEHVRMPGFVSNPYAYMANADLFAISSIYEGICNVIIEAMACGCPVVASDCPGGGPREILEDGKWGRLFPVGDVEALAASMLASLREDKRTQELNARASFFSHQAGIRNYLQLFEACR